MKSLYLLFILIYLTLSVFVLDTKGYFAVRGFSVEGRKDILTYLNQNYNGRSFVLLNKKTLINDLESNFLDVKGVSISRKPDMTLNIDVENKEPIAKTNSGKYISTEGTFYDSILNYSAKVEAKVDNKYLSENVLSKNQVSFILRLSEEFDSVSLEVYAPYHFVIYLDSVAVEVQEDYENIANMSRVVEDIIVNSDKDITKLVVLNSRVVLK